MIVIRILLAIALGVGCMYYTIPLFGYLADNYPLAVDYTLNLDRSTKITALLLASLGHYAGAYLLASIASCLILIIFTSMRDTLRYAMLFCLSAGAYLIAFTVMASNANYLPYWYFVVQGVITLIIPIVTATFFSFIKYRFVVPAY